MAAHTTAGDGLDARLAAARRAHRDTADRLRVLLEARLARQVLRVTPGMRTVVLELRAAHPGEELVVEGLADHEQMYGPDDVIDWGLRAPAVLDELREVLRAELDLWPTHEIDLLDALEAVIA